MTTLRPLHVPLAVTGYIAEQQTLGLAANTVRHQAGFIRRFEVVCVREARDRHLQRPLRTDEIDRAIVARYFSLGSQKPGNMNNHLNALRKFLNWCEAANYIAPGESARLLAGRKHLKAVRDPKHYVPVQQFPVLLDVSGRRHPSERAFMAGALYTLGRKSDVCSISLKDIDLNARVTQMFRPKRNRWTEVGICPELYDEWGSWLDLYSWETGYASAAQMTAKHPDWNIVPRVQWVIRQDPITGRSTGATPDGLVPTDIPRHLERILKRGLDETGAQTTDGITVRHKGEGTHTIRRSAARAMLDHLSKDHGFDRALLQVSIMLDHDDPKQTLIYIGMDEERRELNNWLVSNSPFGTATSAIERGNDGNLLSLPG